MVLRVGTSGVVIWFLSLVVLMKKEMILWSPQNAQLS